MQTAHVAHHVPGRIRLKVQGREDTHHLLEHLQRAISLIPEVNRIDVNRITGSIVIEYDPAHFNHMLEYATRATAQQGLVRLVTPEAAGIDAVLGYAQKEMRELAHYSMTAKQVMALLHRANFEIKHATANAIDLRTLLPLCLSVYSLMTDKKEPSPLWVTLLIFSFNAFVSLHPPRQSQ
jgi:ribose 1,5-bisphosphokinase PhnN